MNVASAAAADACVARWRTPWRSAFDAVATRRVPTWSTSRDPVSLRTHVDELAVLAPYSALCRQIPTTLLPQTSAERLLPPAWWPRTTGSRQGDVVSLRVFSAACRRSASPNHKDDFACYKLYTIKTRRWTGIATLHFILIRNILEYKIFINILDIKASVAVTL